MKKFLVLFLSLLIFVTALLPLSVSAKESNNAQECTVTISEISPRADVIVVKFRIYNGVLQYRRWNETWGYWVDPYWKNVVV